jgi:predicted enzyme related to lactoylglutathione lyase/catechol 2,3-dioxygenase-like lactoylglutathione lyase family enzyme
MVWRNSIVNRKSGVASPASALLLTFEGTGARLRAKVPLEVRNSSGGNVLITQLDRIGLIVSEGDRSADFYADCLGMTRVSRKASDDFNPNVGRVFDVPDAVIRKLIRLSNGKFYLLLFEFTPKGRQQALPVNNLGSLALALPSTNIAEDYRRLSAKAPKILMPPTARGGHTVCYAADPDGSAAGFMDNVPEGIDAVVSVTVNDAAASAAFYANFRHSRLPELDEADTDHKTVGTRLGTVGFQWYEFLRGKGTERQSPMNNAGAVQFDHFTDDIDADYQRIHDYGATVISPPVKTTRGVASTGFDPDGNMWELSSDDGVQPKDVEYYQRTYVSSAERG